MKETKKIRLRGTGCLVPLSQLGRMHKEALRRKEELEKSRTRFGRFLQRLRSLFWTGSSYSHKRLRNQIIRGAEIFKEVKLDG